MAWAVKPSYNPDKPSYGQADFYCQDCKHLINPDKDKKEYGVAVQALQAYTLCQKVNPTILPEEDRVAKACGLHAIYCPGCAKKDKQRQHFRCDRCYQAINEVSGVYDADDDIGFCETCALAQKRRIVHCCNLFAYKCVCLTAVLELLQKK
jgi:hypothetical protein